MRGYTKEQIRAAAVKIGAKVIVGNNGNAIFSTKTPLAPLKEALNPGTAYLPTREEVAGMKHLFLEFVENGKLNTRKAYSHVQKHGTRRFHDKADAQAYADALGRGEGGRWEPKRVNAKNGLMGYWHVARVKLDNSEQGSISDSQPSQDAATSQAVAGFVKAPGHEPFGIPEDTAEGAFGIGHQGGILRTAWRLQARHEPVIRDAVR